MPPECQHKGHHHNSALFSQDSARRVGMICMSHMKHQPPPPPLPSSSRARVRTCTSKMHNTKLLSAELGQAAPWLQATSLRGGQIAAHFQVAYLMVH